MHCYVRMFAELDNNEDIISICVLHRVLFKLISVLRTWNILRGDIASAFRKRERRDIKLINPNLCFTCENRVSVLFRMCQMTFPSRLIHQTSQLSEILW